MNYVHRLEELAQLADPQELWRLSGVQQQSLTDEQKVQLDTAIALRRYAGRIANLQEAHRRGKSIVYTPTSDSGLGVHVSFIDTPPDHKT